MRKFESLKDFCKSKNFIEIKNVIGESFNGYPFITFIDSNNKAENIYFSKAQSVNFSEGMILTNAELKGIQVEYTVNAQGEPRTKLVGVGSSNRLNLGDLLGW